jgi:hypothetical protein
MDGLGTPIVTPVIVDLNGARMSPSFETFDLNATNKKFVLQQQVSWTVKKARRKELHISLINKLSFHSKVSSCVFFPKKERSCLLILRIMPLHG